MKLRKLLPFMALALAPFMAACSNDDDDLDPSKVPDKVRESFEDMYTTGSTTGVDWGKKHDYYVADFWKEGREYEAWFTRDGEWKMTEVDLGRDLSATPVNIQAAFGVTDFTASQIGEIDYYTRPQDEFYVIEVEQGDKDADLFFTVTDGLIKEKWNFNKEILPDTDINKL